MEVPRLTGPVSKLFGIDTAQYSLNLSFLQVVHVDVDAICAL
jgi:hypothetical protein